MGRAIKMENQVDRIDSRLKMVEDASQKVIETLDSMQQKTSKVKQVEKGEKNESKKEKANNEGTGSSNK